MHIALIGRVEFEGDRVEPSILPSDGSVLIVAGAPGVVGAGAGAGAGAGGRVVCRRGSA
jgi:hypothetical protein